jgi:hypothetical protein
LVSRRFAAAKERPVPEDGEDGRARAVTASAWLLEHAQDLVSVVFVTALLAVTWFDRKWKGAWSEVADQEIT